MMSHSIAPNVLWLCVCWGFPALKPIDSTNVKYTTMINRKTKAPNDAKPLLGAVLGKIKKWNWTLFLVIICTAEMGAMGNKNIESISSAFLFGLVAGTILGLPLAILTKDVE